MSTANVSAKLTVPARLTDPQRLKQGAIDSVVGPVNLLRGSVGIAITGAAKALTTAQKYLSSIDTDKAISDAKETAADLIEKAPAVATALESTPLAPEKLKGHGTRKSHKGLKLSVGAFGLLAFLAAGAVAFKLVRPKPAPPVAAAPPSVSAVGPGDAGTTTPAVAQAPAREAGTAEK